VHTIDDGTAIATAPSCLRAMSLERRFALAGSVVMLIAMVIVGTFVSREIAGAVTRNSAISTAVYMESFIAPLSQELVRDDELSEASIARLETLLASPPLSERIISTKLWKRGGQVAFATDRELIGRTFAPDDSLKRAWGGELTATFDDLDEEESSAERATNLPLLEVYNPIHSIITGEIIAVAEFYQDASELKGDLDRAWLQSFATVGLVTLVTFAALFGIVRSGSRTIDRQHRALSDQLAELQRVSTQNVALRRRIQSASARASETNERHLRRLSADLHDGPAQALALASLRLNSVAARAGADGDDPEVAELRSSLAEAMADIRDICRGLTLPELAGSTLAAALETAVSTHERRTSTEVARDIDIPATFRASHGTSICAYRFVQEGLMNAFRHAGGRGQSVAARVVGRSLTLEVHDSGEGFDPSFLDGGGLGLSGLRERVETLGGEVEIDSRRGAGTRIAMTVPLDG
jgi:signal transduction histidine kinase